MEDKLRSELHEAMKKKDALRTSTLRMMMAEITHKQKETGKQVSEEEIFKVLHSMLRKREDAITQFRQGKREDLAEKEEAEMAIIREFLPQQLSEEEIRKEALVVIAEMGAADIKSMGKVMGILTKKLAGVAQGSVISKVVKEELSK
jgi:uncharacterized protein